MKTCSQISNKHELETLTIAITAKHGPCINLSEAAKIIGCNIYDAKKKLEEAGISVKVSGKQKLITAYGLAVCVCFNRVPVTRELL